ncbi:MAG: hypothetical protein B6D39_11595 [Anaerolineae bacterium UTCFX2]|jgi:hypothetical protein|nr:MAG: hypothetical protein B6D39_11595 [Anaerolineae bacterium UTCFX2]
MAFNITGSPFAKRSRLRIPLMVLSLSALVAGLWAGLLRIGWQIPSISTQVLLEHGPLMVAGFLGTLISLERAVALSQLQHGRRIYYLVPLLAGLGGVALFFPVPIFVPHLLITLAALGFLIIFIIIYRLQPATHSAVMGLGVFLWLVGNALWMAGLPVFRVAPWWAAFLVLTIAGERLELTRVLVLTKTVRTLFLVITGIVLVGLFVSLAAFDAGVRIAGFGLAALGVWLFRYDIARHTIRQQGLTRYIAACLLPGYLWLTLGGVLWMIFGGSYPAGSIYDAMLHTIFIGFVFSMIFGHAPVIIPAVMGVPIKYLSVFYVHLSLLHLSLALRIAGDLLLSQSIRRWGGLFNEVAVILFLVVTVISARKGMSSSK